VEPERNHAGRRALFLTGAPCIEGADRLGEPVLESLEVWALQVEASVSETLEKAGIPLRRTGHRKEGAGDGREDPKTIVQAIEEIAHLQAIDLSRSFLATDRVEVLDAARRTGITGILLWAGQGPDPRGEAGPGVVVLPSLGDAPSALREGTPGDGTDPVADAARRIRHGEVVAFPTETVYGLGANAWNPRAVARIFEVKRRPFFDPLIVHLDDQGWVERLAREVCPAARALMDRFWPGPLTLVLPKVALVPDLVTAGLDTVGLRMPAHPVARALIRAAGVPICAPSANPFGYVSPTRPEHVVEQLGHDVDCVLDGGPCFIGIESTIVAFDGNRPVLLRPGAVTAEDLRATLGVDPLPAPSGEVSPLSPGRLPRHYSPRVPVRLFRGEVPPPTTAASGLILLRPRDVPGGYRLVEVLSREGDLFEVAHRLFDALRRLDKEPLDLAMAEVPPEEGIGRAIADRLRRAAARG